MNGVAEVLLNIDYGVYT